ncbi:COG3014 family protein [Wenyingzhuangia sp. 2_MG-2023]|uniref:COG3014 family protein n=1 Tax=Wenyingzhuangia sp. 2_MG-2023 TaxID=3062639 RepID=UPI0026E2FEB1|nr:hypothetical protein [Wenyingzhuangia sp. 2_MG-2023]MDO6737859.1 hypothetical protein [Wenyingzhuangia sp. 2_MG-2023]
MKATFFKYLFVLTFVQLIISCASYHDLSIDYQEQIQQENYESAYKKIEKSKFLNKKRNKLLNYLEKGKIAHLQKEYKLSNELFNEADILIEDHKNNFGNQILGVLTNPEKETYRSEDFEKVAIHYYKALNYIFLNQYDDALVEAKRINLQLQKINDKYPEGKKNRYTSDAFSLNLQGLLYEVTGNLNDAFISYRNAVELYLENEGSYFGVSIPTQLKQDLINTAHYLGFTSDELRYSELFKLKYTPKTTEKSLIVFWENGMIPYKSQTYFTFTQLPGRYNNGFVTITNEELGMNIPVPVSSSQNSRFSDLSVINVSFPKYEDRPSYFSNAKVIVDQKKYPLELVQDYSVIAKETLKDRTLREIGKVVLRLAAKKMSEKIIKDQNANLGALVGLFNAITEKSDTRNWQTLPNKIYYTRIPLEDQNTQVKIEATGFNGNKVHKEFEIDPNQKITFINYNTPQINKAN